MQQELVDSAKFKLSIISLDSRFADQRDCNNSEFKLTLAYPMKNIMRIRLASIELPLVEYLFSEQYGNLNFAVRIGASPNFIECKPLAPGNYLASQLVNSIQAALAAVHSGFSCFLNPIDGRLTVRNSSVKFELYMASNNPEIASRKSNWGLGYYVGFRSAYVPAIETEFGSWEVTGDSIVNVQNNQYYLLQLFCPESVDVVSHRIQDNEFITAFAKLILRDGQFTVAFDDNSNLLRKEYTFLAPVTIPFFTVKILNAYGEEVDMQNLNWSLAIETTEIVNSKTYSSISKTYSRA
jgi:hypothetical protein